MPVSETEFFDALWASLNHGTDLIVTMDQFLQLSEIGEENKAAVSLTELRLEDTQADI